MFEGFFISGAHGCLRLRKAPKPQLATVLFFSGARVWSVAGPHSNCSDNQVLVSLALSLPFFPLSSLKLW